MGRPPPDHSLILIKKRCSNPQQHLSLRLYFIVGRIVGKKYIKFKNIIISIYYINIMAEREGFEPSRGFHPYTLSRRAP
jgi:hypothetical protein